MAERHELGFLRFVGRGLRYVAILGTLWIGLAGWQAGALKCRPRDRFIGWKAPQQYERLHLVASNTRLLVLPEPGAFPNLGSWFVGGMLRRLSGEHAHDRGWPVARIIGGSCRAFWSSRISPDDFIPVASSVCAASVDPWIVFEESFGVLITGRVWVACAEDPGGVPCFDPFREVWSCACGGWEDGWLAGFD